MTEESEQSTLYNRMNVAVNAKTFIKLGPYKSLILPILFYGFW